MSAKGLWVFSGAYDFGNAHMGVGSLGICHLKDHLQEFNICSFEEVPYGRSFIKPWALFQPSI